MSLQDEHLQQALKNAPDHDLTPSDAVRKKVLAHAQERAQKQSSWFKRSLQALGQWRVRGWQVAGMSTIASVFIVMFIARPQLPDEMIWRHVDEQDIASTETLELEAKDEASSEPMPSTQSTFSDADDTAVVKQVPKEAARKETAPPAATDKLAKKRVKTKPQVPAKKAEARTDVTVEEEVVVTTGAPAPTIASEPSTTADMTGETKAVIVAAPEKRSARRMQEQSDLPEEGQARALGQAVSGATLAAQDIKAGRFRILFASYAWPEGKSSVDEETGFLIELSDMPAHEVERYNKTMRDWYRKQSVPPK